MRLGTILKLAAVAAVAVTVALIAVAKSIDFNKYRGFLTAQVRELTGRELTISGQLDLRLGLNPAVIATGVTFGNAPGASRKDMISFERIEAELSILPLLRREIRVRRMILVAPDVILETDARGVGNWIMTPATSSAAAADAAKPADGSPPTRFDIGQVRVRDARLTWRDGTSGETIRVNLHKVMVTPERGATGPVDLLVIGDTDGRHFQVSGLVGSLAALGTGKPWPVQLKASVDGTVLVADGVLADPSRGKGMDIKLTAHGDELSELLKSAGVRLNGNPPPPLGPFKLATRLTDGEHGPQLVDLDAALGKHDLAVVSAKGGIRDLAGLSGVELQVSAETDDLAGLSRLAEGPLPSMGPLRLSGRLSDLPARNGWRLAEMKGQLAGSDLSGDLTLHTAGAQPRLTGRLSSSRLALADLLGPAAKPGETIHSSAAGPQPKPAADARLFPATALPVASLRGLEAELTLAVGRLALGQATLADLSAEARLGQGRLTVKPLSAILAGGLMEGELVLDGSRDPAAVSARLMGKGVELGRLLKETGASDALTGGRADLSLDLAGRGQSLRAVMASANGQALLTVGEARIENTAVNWAGGDVLMQVLGSLNPLAASEKSTRMTCAVARFVLKDGIATADKGIAVETAKVDVVGSGAVDLRSEALDLGITPRPREGVGLSLGGTLSGMTRLRGTLLNPSVGVDELGTARAAASVGAAMATGGLSLLGEMLFDRVTADGTPCRTAMGGKPAAPAKPAKRGLSGR